MIRNKGTFNLSANFEPLFQGPLDARQVVETYLDLMDPSTWMDSENLVWVFDGLIVSVAGDTDASKNGVYFLNDSQSYTSPTSWIRIGQTSAVDISSLKFYIDGSLATRDSSISLLFQNIATINASIYSIDASIIRIDGSLSIIYKHLSTLDASIIGLNGTYVRESSLGYGLSWNPSGQLDVSIITNIPGDVSASRVYYDTTLDPSLKMPSAVGGIPANTTVYDLKGDSITSILNDLLFPTVNPTFVVPSETFADNTANVHEIGEFINVTYTATFNRGQILIGSTEQDKRSGLPNNYKFTDPSGNTLLVDVSSSSLTNIQYVYNYLVNIGNQNWSAAISYDQGPQPLDSKGNPYGSPLVAGTLGAQSVIVEGVYPIFGTTSVLSGFTKQTLVSMSASSVIMNMVSQPSGSLDKQAFKIPDAWIGDPTYRPLLAVQQYNTVSSQWEYPGGSAATSLALWNTSASSEVIQGNSVPYTMYTYNGPDRSSVQIKLIF